MKKHQIIIEKTANQHYSAYVPSLPGCVATGRSKAQVTVAIAFHLAGLAEDNTMPNLAVAEKLPTAQCGYDKLATSALATTA